MTNKYFNTIPEYSFPFLCFHLLFSVVVVVTKKISHIKNINTQPNRHGELFITKKM